MKRVVLAAAALVVGCGPDNGRLPLKGAVSYKGQPVPRGVILFEPPPGGPGLQGSADIRDGRYQTLSNFGPRAGAYTARVTGYDGKEAPNFPEGMMIVDTALAVTIPEKGGTLDIDLSESKGPKASK